MVGTHVLPTLGPRPLIIALLPITADQSTTQDMPVPAGVDREQQSAGGGRAPRHCAREPAHNHGPRTTARPWPPTRQIAPRRTRLGPHAHVGSLYETPEVLVTTEAQRVGETSSTH